MSYKFRSFAKFDRRIEDEMSLNILKQTFLKAFVENKGRLEDLSNPVISWLLSSEFFFEFLQRNGDICCSKDN